MNTFMLRILSLLAAAVLVGTPPRASAVTLSTVVTPIYQVGNGAGVYLGHTVSARTNYNRLTAGGSYIASCASALMQATTGQRTLSTENILGGLSLFVTVPANHPALVNMPGFYSLPRGTTVSCTYNWTSRAVEGGYTVGAGGIGFVSGNGERTEGSTQNFHMSVPSLGSEDGYTSCIP